MQDTKLDSGELTFLRKRTLEGSVMGKSARKECASRPCKLEADKIEYNLSAFDGLWTCKLRISPHLLELALEQANY